MRKLTCSILLLSLVFFIMNCKTQNTASYSYSDGNGNYYLIEKTNISFKPVTPDMSSSGTYSGGEPITVKISEEQYKKLMELVNAAIDAKSMHISERVKMSGMISISQKGNAQTYILGARSRSKADIESYLKQLFKK